MAARSGPRASRAKAGHSGSAVFEKQEVERTLEAQPALHLRKYRVVLIDDNATERDQIRWRLEGGPRAKS
jgi:hypothetical protein